MLDDSLLQPSPETHHFFTRHYDATAHSLKLQFILLATAAFTAPFEYRADNLLQKISLLAAIAYWFTYALIRGKRDASPTPLDQHLLRYGFLYMLFGAAIMLVSAARAAGRL